jgi:hypothetical protein
MNEEIKHALETDRLIDITTIGRKTGNSHRIEIAFHYYDEIPYIRPAMAALVPVFSAPKFSN